MSEYKLQTNALGRKRLDLQGQLYNPGSQKFLWEQGLSKGCSVLEVGCGSGSMTAWLAQQVGSQGRVLAIDSSRSQVLATRRSIKKMDAPQAEVQELSVYDLDQLSEQFDFIYVRCVLIHLENPLKALMQMFHRLKKGGRLVVDEILNSCNFCYPHTSLFDQRRQAIEQFFIKNNRQPNFGLTLKPLLKQLQLKDIQEFAFQPLLISDQQRQLLSLFFYEIKDKLISLNILN